MKHALVFQGRGFITVFDDPSRFAKECRSEEETLGHYRRVRTKLGGL